MSAPRGQRLEWLAAAVAGAVVLWIVAVLLRAALSGAQVPPVLGVALEPPVAEAGGLHLRFTLSNRGGRAASAVGVALIGAEDGAILRRLTVDYAPAGSEVGGGFLLRPEEAAAAPVAIVEGYVDP